MKEKELSTNIHNEIITSIRNSQYVKKIICIICLTIMVNILICIVLRMNVYKTLENIDVLNEEIIVDKILLNNSKSNYEEDLFTEDTKKILRNQIDRDKYIIGKKNNKIITKMYYNTCVDEFIKKCIVENSSYIKKVANIKKQVYLKCKYYPILVNSNKNNIDTFSYDNSWNTPRNYGGNRKHEGTDIMSKENKSDIVPIISISDGIIVKKGWLKLGGYRLYIRVSEDLYLYYAHLSSYEPNINEGDKVYAGQVLGYMGSTGYGKEGTDNKFPVHLHLGIYSKNNNNVEKAINPYYLLKFLENNKLYYKK